MIEDTARSPQDILEEASNIDTEAVYALVSGGTDSTTAAHIAHQSEFLDLDGIVYIDTGIGIPASRRWVQNWVDSLGLPCHVVGSEYRKEKEEFHNLIVNFGFPGPPVHKQMFVNLKQKPLQRFLSDVVDGKPLLISGVRAHESTRRMENIDSEAIQIDDLGTWVSPIISFTDANVDAYQDKHEIPTNPVTEKLHVSGDCLCGAYARSREELRELKLFYPAVFEYLDYLESHAADAARRGRFPEEFALWGHGNEDEGSYSARLDTEQTGFNLCADCENRCDSGYSMDGTSLTKAESNLKQSSDTDCNRPHLCTHCWHLIEDPKAHREECPETIRGIRRDYRAIDILESKYRGEWVTEADPKESEFCTVEDSHDWAEGDVDGVAACTHCGAFHLGSGDEPAIPWHSVGDDEPPAEQQPESTTAEASDSPDRTLAEFVGSD